MISILQKKLIVRFVYSTKKKSSHKTQISKPSINETNAILSGFEDVNSESAHVHCAFDHSYDTI